MAKPGPLILIATISAAAVAATLTIALRDSSTATKDSSRHEGDKPVQSSEANPPAPTVLERPESSPDQREVPAAPAPSSSAEKPVAPKRFADLLSMPEATRAEMEAKKARIDSTIQESTMPIFVQRFEAGLSEFVSSEQSYAEQPRDNYEIKGVQMVPGKGTYRTALPRIEYPDLYELRDESARLAKAAGRKLVEEAVAKRNQEQGATPR